jgi:hypothetical protein
MAKNPKKKNTTKQIELAFPKYEEQKKDYISKGKGEDVIEYLSTSVDQLTNWFKQYQIESIELSISGALETGGILKLIVSAKGEAGLKVVLKPRQR